MYGHVYMCVCAVSQKVCREQRAAVSHSLFSLCELAGLNLGREARRHVLFLVEPPHWP